MRNYLLIAIALLLALATGSCAGSFEDSGGTYSFSVPSSDSVSATFSESGQPATVVGGPISGSVAAQQGQEQF